MRVHGVLLKAGESAVEVLENPEKPAGTLSQMSRRLIPLFNRLLIEKLVPPTKSVGGILLPESAMAKVQEGTVIAAGPGMRTRDGDLIPMSVKVGDQVLLPNFGGTEVKVDNKEYTMYTEDEILGRLE